MSEPQHITIEEAASAVEAAAFTIVQTGWDMQNRPVPTDAGRRIIHTFAGPVGADWDADDAVAFIARSSDRAWVDNVFDHDLGVLGARWPTAG
jgi:hypothetical protein